MENNIMNSLTTYFGSYGLIIFNKQNEYYKVALPKTEIIKNLYDTLDTNPQYENWPDKINYLACCLYLICRKDSSFKDMFMKKIISKLLIKKDPKDDIHLALIYNCIDFDENFLHSEPKKLSYLSKYLQKFSEEKKEESMSLLFKYYNAILNYRIGNTQDALNECFGIIGYINANTGDKIINFIKLKAQIFLAKINEENISSGGMAQLQENANLLKDIYSKTISENPFLALKIGFYIFNNSYNRNLFAVCIEILEQMIKILKDYERQGVPAKKLTRFYLSIFSRYGIIGLLIGNKQYLNMAIEGMKMQLLLIQDLVKTNPKVRHIFKAYSFSLNLLKLDTGIYVENPQQIGESFMKEFSTNVNKSFKDENYCINEQIKEQSIVNYNAMISHMNVDINEKAYKYVDEYLNKINKPNQNYISNEIVLTFVVGIYDRIRYIIEQYLSDKNVKNQIEYKNEVLNNCDLFFKFIDSNLERIPILRSEFMKHVIIKIFSSFCHMYIFDKDFNKIQQMLIYFDKLSSALSINENTPAYELIFKIKGDLSFSQNDYNNAIAYYSRSIQLMNEKNPKKAIVYFNLGVLYYYANDRNKSIENMQRAAMHFKKSDEQKYSFGFHKRNNLPSKKFNITNALINKIQSC